MKRTKTLVEELPGLLDASMMSVDDIAERLGRNRGAVGNLIRKLHAQKAVYIAAWRRAKGNHAALWQWGSLPDAEPLPNLTNADKKAIADYERGGLAAIDPLLAAIMGVGR